jgi:signal transduction histidine kinase
MSVTRVRRGIWQQLRRLPRRRPKSERSDEAMRASAIRRIGGTVPSRRTTALLLLVGMAGVAAAIATSLSASSLAHPEWLAVQKSDLILGPIAVGLYWWWRRPRSRFGPLLVGFGLFAIPNVLQGVSDPLPYSIGVAWDAPFFLVTIWLILAFPSGRLERPVERAIVLVTIGALLAFFVPYLLFSPEIEGGGPISECAKACPSNAFLIAPHLGLVSTAGTFAQYSGIVVALATAAVLVRRLLKRSPRQRVGFAAGSAAGLAFAIAYGAFHLTELIAPSASGLHSFFQWALVAARASIPYGILLTLLLAELSAGRVLRELVGATVHRPSATELEAMVSRTLNDGSVRLGAWADPEGAYVGIDGTPIVPPPPQTGRTMTEVSHNGQRSVALVHSSELNDDPELVRAAGAGALLTLENERLEDALSRSLDAVRQSRDRLAAAGDAERRRLERDLHDGAQQQLVALAIQLGLLADLADPGSELEARVRKLTKDVEDAIASLRDLAHGLYPWRLTDSGLVSALRAGAEKSGRDVLVSGEGVGRYPMNVEAAIYYCAMEALQNVTKHAGASARTTVALRERAGRLMISVIDDGAGFDQRVRPRGAGLHNMEDRLAAVGGHLELRSQPGQGTRVTGWVPVPRLTRASDEGSRLRRTPVDCEVES